MYNEVGSQLVSGLYFCNIQMPSSPNKVVPSDSDKAARTQLAERVSLLESEIENLKEKLNDQSIIEQLAQRVANCEHLAGIVSPIKEE
jgi:hypothetical protein